MKISVGFAAAYSVRKFPEQFGSLLSIFRDRVGRNFSGRCNSLPRQRADGQQLGAGNCPAKLRAGRRASIARRQKWRRSKYLVGSRHK